MDVYPGIVLVAGEGLSKCLVYSIIIFSIICSCIHRVASQVVLSCCHGSCECPGYCSKNAGFASLQASQVKIMCNLMSSHVHTPPLILLEIQKVFLGCRSNVATESSSTFIIIRIHVTVFRHLRSPLVFPDDN